MKKALIAFYIALLLFSLCACGNKYIDSSTDLDISTEQDTSTEQETTTAPENIELNSEYSIKYNFKINPEFTVCADDDLRVTDINAENEDAEAVLANVDVLGLDVNEAFEIITNEAQNQGYMSKEKGNTVDITILEKDDDKMPTCHICGGCGTIICLECNGTGIFGNCEPCSGTGLIHFDAGPVCPHCSGSGICSVCNGKGQIIITNGEDGGIVYVSEGVAETGKCSGCDGDGVCRNCRNGDYSSPSHDEVCEGCHGAGVIYCNDDLNGYRWCPCCWGSGIDGTGDPDCEQWLRDNGY